MHELRPFKYNNTCGLCDNIQEKDKMGIIRLKKFFVIHEKVIDVFHQIFYIPTIEKLSFYIYHVRIIGSMEFGNTKIYLFMIMHQK